MRSNGVLVPLRSPAKQSPGCVDAACCDLFSHLSAISLLTFDRVLTALTLIEGAFVCREGYSFVEFPASESIFFLVLW